jgi:Amt family ammonium transporter
VLIQLVGVVAAWVFSFVLAFVFLKIADALLGLRVDAETEIRGLDLGEFSEAGYELEM